MNELIAPDRVWILVKKTDDGRLYHCSDEVTNSWSRTKLPAQRYLSVERAKEERSFYYGFDGKEKDIKIVPLRAKKSEPAVSP